MDRKSLAQYLNEFAAKGSEIAYVQPAGYRTERWTYRRVAGTGFRFARELQARGIVKGDRVMIWGPNSAQWVAVFLGCASQGVVVVPMDDAASAEFAARVAEQVTAKLLLCSREHVGEATVPAIVLEELGDGLSRHSASPLPMAEVSSDDILEIVFTSGTTAEPKGVVITHRNVLGNVAPLETEIEKYKKYERWVHPVRFLNLLPLSHVFGQFLGIFLPQLLGATVVFQGSLKPSELIATTKRERVSLVVAVPRVLQSLKEKLERDLQDVGALGAFDEQFRRAEGKHFLHRWWIFRRMRRQFGWKFWAFVSGGAALDRVTEEFWTRLGYAVIQGYGLTETTSMISLNHPFRLGKGSIGKVLAGREVKLGEGGEIMVRGGGVAAGYWSAEELRPVVSEDGWYATGDIGEIDTAGNLYFKGRMKDVIVTPAGMNVYPEDLEAALRLQTEVKECVVVGLPKGGNAEACAAMILRAGADPAAVVERANKRLAEYQQIRHWFVWRDEDFPRTPTRKSRRNEILRVVLAQGKNGGTAGARGVLSDLIARTGRGGISTSSELEADLNLSSLDRVELMGALEDRYQVDLSEATFAAVKTVGDLERMLHGQVPPRVKYHYPKWVQRWPHTWVRWLVHYALLRPAMFFLGWPKVEGRNHLQGVKGPLLVVCNHISGVDVAYILTALPARFRNRLATAAGGEALEALRTPPPSRKVLLRIYDRVVWFLGVTLLNIFPLPRQAGFRESFAYAGESVDRGYSVLVFPEGRHTLDGSMFPFRGGVGLLANNLKIPILPMRIDGLFELKQEGRRMTRPGKIQVRIGEPVQFNTETDPEQFAHKLQGIVEGL